MSDNRGKAGAIRRNALDRSGLSKMERHELRLDYAGVLRAVEPDRPPLIYSPHGENLTLTERYDAHVKGARRNAAASKIATHAFVQFPTDLEITPETEEIMLKQAVDFIEKHHGGRAVFSARLDRDEAGKHGVDVFFAPRYSKTTAKGTDDWISLTKFGKKLARDRLGQRQKETYNKKTKKWKKHFKDDGSPDMVWKDSAHFQGQVFQDYWFEHLRDVMGLDWVQRGKQKIGRDPDRVEPEEYKIQQDKEKLAAREAAVKVKEAKLAQEQRALDARENAVREDFGARETALGAREAAVKAKEAELAQDRKEFAAEKADFDKTSEWVERGLSNLQIAIDRVQAGTYDKEITSEDMPDEPEKFAVLKAAAPDNRPTLGFRARFWSLNYSNSGTPVSLPDKIRTSLTRAYDRVAKWATEVRTQQKEAQAAKEAAVAEGRAEGRAQAQKEAQSTREAARLILTGQLPGASISEDAQVFRDAASKIEEIKRIEPARMRASPYATRETALWSEAAEKYRDRLPAGVWETARDEVKAAHEDGKEMIEALPENEPLLSRAQNLASTIAAYWNGVEAAFSKLFAVRDPANDSEGYGVISALLPQPLNEYSYSQPLQRVAERELATQDLAEKLQPSNDPSPF